MPSLPKARTFTGPSAFRAWLERHHDRESELLVRCFKNHAAGEGLTYFQALDEALCFGWIDGVRRRLDGDSFSVRFSPRKARSKWSAVNVQRATALEGEGRMRPPGKEAFRKRGEGRDRTAYSYESRPQALSPAYLKKLRANGPRLEVLRRAGSLVPAHERLLGDERQARSHADQASGPGHRLLGERTDHSALEGRRKDRTIGAEGAGGARRQAMRDGRRSPAPPPD